MTGFYSYEGEFPMSFPFKIKTYQEYLVLQVFDWEKSEEILAIYRDD